MWRWNIKCNLIPHFLIKKVTCKKKNSLNYTISMIILCLLLLLLLVVICISCYYYYMKISIEKENALLYLI